MNTETPVPVLCRYLLKPGHEEQFKQLLEGHWDTLHRAGLTTSEPARILRAHDKAGNVAFVESFSWRAESSAQTAHETAAVMKLWEPMGAYCEDMEFWNVEPI